MYNFIDDLSNALVAPAASSSAVSEIGAKVTKSSSRPASRSSHSRAETVASFPEIGKISNTICYVNGIIRFMNYNTRF
jgi:hypothetical protein